MNSIYEDKGLIARVARLYMRTFVEEPGKRGGAKGMRRSTPYFPVLQGSQFHGQPGFSQDANGLGLAELIGLSPTSQVLNHGGQVLRHLFPIMTDTVGGHQL
jgi:hypothetical protein